MSTNPADVRSFIGFKEAHEALHANKSPRYCRLEELERWVDGTQYHHKVPWFAPVDVPLWDRAPCIVYPVVQIASSSNCDLVFGEGGPKFSTKPGEDESDDDDPEDGGLDEEESAAVDRLIAEYHKACRFVSASREIYVDGQGKATGVAIYGVRNGKPTADIQPAKWCTPTFDTDRCTVLSLEVRYPYLEQYQVKPSGEWAVRAKIYRRVIDATRDVTYKPADARPDGREPESWVEDVAITHGFGFCPVVWYPFMRGHMPVNEIDGKAIHRLLPNEILAHDIARSQWHRGALLSEPQPWETGVDADHNPTDSGRPALVQSTPRGGEPGDDNPINGGYVTGGTGGSGSARKRGPGWVWRYPNPDTKLGVLTYPGESLKAQQDNCSDLRIKLQEALCVVFLDPENIKFAATTSGKALEAIKQKQIDRCTQHRDDLRDNFLLPSVDMQMRIAATVGDGLKIRGLKKALPVLKKCMGPDGWNGPTIHVKWPDWFKPDVTEQNTVVTMIVAALKAGVITKRIALEKIAPIFSIENVTAALEEIEAKDAENKAHEADLAHAAGNLLNGAPPGKRNAAGQDPPPGARPGSGAPARPTPKQPRGAPAG